jgi:hypothetical protein
MMRLVGGGHVRVVVLVVVVVLRTVVVVDIRVVVQWEDEQRGKRGGGMLHEKEGRVEPHEDKTRLGYILWWAGSAGGGGEV